MALASLNRTTLKGRQVAHMTGLLSVALVMGCADNRKMTPVAQATSTAPLACTDTLENVQRIGPQCPNTYSPTTDGPEKVCGDHFNFLKVGAWDQFSFIWYGYGAGESTCAYRSSDSALIGIVRRDDGPYFCDGTSSEVTAGEVPDFDWEAMTDVACP
jgi:hypothetical protein